MLWAWYIWEAGVGICFASKSRTNFAPTFQTPNMCGFYGWSTHRLEQNCIRQHFLGIVETEYLLQFDLAWKDKICIYINLCVVLCTKITGKKDIDLEKKVLHKAYQKSRDTALTVEIISYNSQIRDCRIYNALLYLLQFCQYFVSSLVQFLN